MVYDIITFNGEVEMLEIRMQILASYVDKFVIVEATETFSRQPKELTYKPEIYKQWQDKIIYHVIDDFTDEKVLEMARNSSNTGNGEIHWVYEFYQKEKIKDALIGLNDEDICFVSDVDEIWNPEVLGIFIDDHVYKPLQNLCYIYYLNQRTTEDWTYFTGTIITRYKNIKNACLNHLRTHSKNNYRFIENGGWHFNSLGGKDRKIDAFKHPVYTVDYMESREKGLHIDESDIPQYLKDNKEKYKHLFL